MPLLPGLATTNKVSNNIKETTLLWEWRSVLFLLQYEKLDWESYFKKIVSKWNSKNSFFGKYFNGSLIFKFSIGAKLFL